ncbi:DUF3068 domain-containing protein [Rhodococcus rhodochrous]|uniref:DUF3068 domain-containing protein n=1 Tax=Rhodococcus rhodochrous TaxID=1829 RepID=UPI000D059994|nr:DUF3068 domain-containing protein [Rhodococcus rhodochrous]
MPLSIPGARRRLALVAIVLPTYVAKSLVKFPDRIHQVTRATGTGDVLDFRQLLEGTVHIDHEVPVQLTTLVNSVVPTDSNLVTLCASFEVTRRDRTDTSRLLDASVDQVAVSRTTGMPQRRPAMTMFELDQKPLETVRHGLQYKFPFGTAKRDHPYFDAISQRETTMAYVDDSTVRNGLRLLHFRADIPVVDLSGLLPMRGRVDLPARLLGGKGGDELVGVSLYYSATRDYWVEPTTGAVVIINEHQLRYLATTADAPDRITVFDGDLKFDDQTIDQMATQVAAARKQITALRVIGPSIAALGSVAALIIGIRRLRSARYRRSMSAGTVGGTT